MRISSCQLIFLGCAAAALLGACAPLERAAPRAQHEPVAQANQLATHVPPFSGQSAGILPQGWKPWILNRQKVATEYQLAQEGTRIALRADAASSASGLYVPLVPGKRRHLRWEWKTDNWIEAAENSSRQREDSPLRIFVAFGGDIATLPLKDQLMFEMARVTTGREMPYATLMYIWGARRPVGSVVANPHTDRVRMIVVDSGKGEIGRWRAHERDLQADYRKAFGADPGPVLALGVMTDTDNTKSHVRAWYGDIVLD
ncbi:DUF3047 domain-containing protein [Imbroritus primus]|uniref:DUF3047 domain-containing protein n=2 Tax=Imbroritus primus TaxID=3058603 RepID=A0ACD3SPI3_9BURK|nr:DUF3047 domain-containing protein [Burkholderiaceae bacterium PBA]